MTEGNNEVFNIDDRDLAKMSEEFMPIDPLFNLDYRNGRAVRVLPKALPFVDTSLDEDFVHDQTIQLWEGDDKLGTFQFDELHDIETPYVATEEKSSRLSRVFDKINAFWNPEVEESKRASKIALRVGAVALTVGMLAGGIFAVAKTLTEDKTSTETAALEAIPQSPLAAPVTIEISPDLEPAKTVIQVQTVEKTNLDKLGELLTSERYNPSVDNSAFWEAFQNMVDLKESQNLTDEQLVAVLNQIALLDQQ